MNRMGPHPATAIMEGVERLPFGEAFALARRAGWPNFRWRGTWYHTRLASMDHLPG